MLLALKRYLKRKRINAAKQRHEAIQALRMAVRRKDTRAQHEAEKAAREATLRALRLGA